MLRHRNALKPNHQTNRITDGYASLTATKRRLCGVVRLLHNGECLNETLFSSLDEARALLEAWREDYNRVRPHSSLANRTPEEFRLHHSTLVANPATGQKTQPRTLSMIG